MATEYKRVVIKKGNGIPTIPTSNDHTDGTWLATDIYVGEFYLDTGLDKIYMRTALGIEEVIFSVADFESIYNKATDFSAINNIKYPSTQAVDLHIDSKLASANYFTVKGTEVKRGFVAQNNSTTLFLENIAVGSAVGTTTAVTAASGSELSKMVRTRVQVSTPAVNGICSYRSTTAMHFVGTGFRFNFGFSYSDSTLNTGARQFYGMTATTGAIAISSTILVETLLNCIGIGSDALDTNLQIFHNDASGTCTKIDLGSQFPANRNGGPATDFFIFELYNEPNTLEVQYRVTSIQNSFYQTSGTITTNLPSNTTLLTMQACRTSGASSNNCSFDYSQMVISSIA